MHMQMNPIVSIGTAASAIAKTVPAVTSALQKMAKLGIVSEITGRKRSRVFVYRGCIDLIGSGTEPLK
jgi:predicted transcriptional regulator